MDEELGGPEMLAMAKRLTESRDRIWADNAKAALTAARSKENGQSR